MRISIIRENGNRGFILLEPFDFFFGFAIQELAFLDVCNPVEPKGAAERCHAAIKPAICDAALFVGMPDRSAVQFGMATVCEGTALDCQLF